MNIEKFFYILFVIDLLVGLILYIFVNLFVSVITTFTLLFINVVTFIIIKKILKIQKEYNKTKNS